MLPTVAGDGVDASSVDVAVFRRVPTVVQQLDEVLFRPGGWFALSRGNQRVPGVVVGSLPAGLGLVGRGGVASLVGRLRPGFRVVDVDVEGLPGHAIAEEVAGWCRARGVWVLLRPSGGADGRTHCFAAVGDRAAEFEEFVAGLRLAYGVARTRVEVRVLVRPLSAPHRLGAETRPLGHLGDALKALLAASCSSPFSFGQTRHGAGTGTGPGGRAAGLGVALVPRRRRCRDVPPQWRVFLESGRRPVLDRVEGGDYSRSTFEAIATACMVRAGWSVEQAWAAIQSAHAGAMDHARAGGRDRWVRHVWNRAVEADTASPSPAAAGELEVDPAVGVAVAAARARLRVLAWSVSPRQRVSLLRVGWAVLDRMERTNRVRVPVPERDLVLDTGIRDRSTVRAQLRRLNGPVGVLDTGAFRPADRASSSFEFAIPEAPAGVGGVPEIPPPGCHTPLPPRMPLDAPAAAWLLAGACARDSGREWTVEELVTECQLAPSPGTPVVGKRARTVREALTVLLGAGIVACTPTGRWVFTSGEVADLRGRDASWDGLVEQIDQERQAYRAGGSSRWQVARAAALKRDRARQHAWWAGLDPSDRAARQTRWAARFDRLSVQEQYQFKTASARRSEAEGVSPAARHQRWLYEADPDDLALVAFERAARYAALPHPLQVASVQAWQAYRTQYGVPRGSWQLHTRTTETEQQASGPARRVHNIDAPTG